MCAHREGQCNRVDVYVQKAQVLQRLYEGENVHQYIIHTSQPNKRCCEALLQRKVKISAQKKGFKDFFLVQAALKPHKRRWAASGNYCNWKSSSGQTGRFLSVGKNRWWWAKPNHGIRKKWLCLLRRTSALCEEFCAVYQVEHHRYKGCGLSFLQLAFLASLAELMPHIFKALWPIFTWLLPSIASNI